MHAKEFLIILFSKVLKTDPQVFLETGTCFGFSVVFIADLTVSYASFSPLANSIFDVLLVSRYPLTQDLFVQRMMMLFESLNLALPI